MGVVNFSSLTSFSGFTLAEVLITLGIIGVVTAMTLPTVLNSIQNKQLESSLKKSYSVLSQVTQRVVNEDLGGVIESKSSYEITQLFVKYYNNSNVCSGNDNKNGCPDHGGGC